VAGQRAPLEMPPQLSIPVHNPAAFTVLYGDNGGRPGVAGSGRTEVAKWKKLQGLVGELIHDPEERAEFNRMWLFLDRETPSGAT